MTQSQASAPAHPGSEPARLLAVSRSAAHDFGKTPTAEVTLVEGLGVEGDCHAGRTVQHLSRVRRDPTQPNLRQVHLIHAELLEELNDAGFDVIPGALGENLTTLGVDILALPRGSRLTIGEAVIEVTGLRNPCVQLDRFRAGLQRAVLDRDEDGAVVRRAGVMGVVLAGGVVRPGDRIDMALPEPPHTRLEPV